MQMMAVAIGWQVYEITGNPLDLGLIGLAEFLPVPLLVLLAGHAADRFERRRVIQISDGARALMALALLKITFDGAAEVWPFYLLALAMGVTRAFGAPAGPRHAAGPGAARSDRPMPSPGGPPAFRCRSWSGRLLGGLLYALLPVSVYGVSALLLAASVLLMFAAEAAARGGAGGNTQLDQPGGGHPLDPAQAAAARRHQPRPVRRAAGRCHRASAHLRQGYPGGRTSSASVCCALAPAVGAIVMAVALAYFPLRSAASATRCISRSPSSAWRPSSLRCRRTSLCRLLALAILGAADLVSVFIRSTVVPLATPDHMRGRVTAVEMVFIGASNELGMFESGLLAWLIGTVPAALVGGVGTLLVVLLWIRLFPDLYKVDRLDHRLDE